MDSINKQQEEKNREDLQGINAGEKNKGTGGQNKDLLFLYCYHQRKAGSRATDVGAKNG